MKYAIIVGAGPAGLTAAYELLINTDIIPIIFEEDSQPGGISKTINYKGNKIDIGGHRFFSKSEKVIDWWLQFLPLEADAQTTITYQNNSTIVGVAENITDSNKGMMVRPRKSRIYFNQQFFDYPLQLNLTTVRKLGFLKTMLFGLSYTKAKLIPRQPEKTLEDFFINRFGDRLYRTFFKEYTEKVWGVACNKLPATWGRQRVKDLNVGQVLRHAIRSVFYTNRTLQQKGTSTSLIEQFMYPRYGPGQMWETVAEKIKELGGEIHYNTKVNALTGKDGRIESVSVVKDGQEHKHHGDYFFSTMPVKELIEGLNGIPIPDAASAAATSLQYRDFLIVGILVDELAVKEGKSFTDNWIYLQDNGLLAGRVQFFHNWSPYMVQKPGSIWIGVEFFCNETDAFWNQKDEAIIQQAIEEMQRIKILPPNHVQDAMVAKVKKAYPSYFGGYKDFKLVQDFLNTIPNLYPIGRNGMHRYNNSDHSMLTAMEAVNNIKNGRTDKSNIWEINTEDSYHEAK